MNQSDKVLIPTGAKRANSVDAGEQEPKRQKTSVASEQLVVADANITTTVTTVIKETVSTDAPQSAISLIDSLSKTPNAAYGGRSEAELLQLECETMDPSWLNVLSSEVRKDSFLKLKAFLWNEGVKSVAKPAKAVFPPAKDIYSWSRFTPFDKVRVVILGQDPYHNDGQAHGLAFSVRPNVAIPPSLRNMYKEIKTEYPDFEVPKHGNLASWAASGVLLLNTSLTVHAHQAGSHSKKGWEQFTDKIVSLISARKAADGKDGGVVFLAWGAWAQKRMALVDRKRHLVLESAHPSPLSARRGFFGNGHFKSANEWLVKHHGEHAKIDWTKLDPNAQEPGNCLADIGTSDTS